MKELNSVDIVEIECPLHIQKHPHLIHEFCAQNEDRLEGGLPYDVPLQHIYNL